MDKELVICKYAGESEECYNRPSNKSGVCRHFHPHKHGTSCTQNCPLIGKTGVDCLPIDNMENNNEQ